MRLDKLKLVFYNSIFGLSPILLYTILTLILPFNLAVLTSYFFNLLIIFAGTIHLVRHRIYCFSLAVSLFAFTFYSILMNVTSVSILCRAPNFSIELILFATLLIILLNRQRLVRYVNLNFKPTVRADIRNSLDEMFHTFYTLSVLFATHLLISMIYILTPCMVTVHRSLFIFQYLPPIILITVGIYEQLRIYFISEEVKNDRFVYVVDEEGTAIGKIAFAEAVKTGTTYCHPYVRIAIIQNNLVYLSKCPSSSIHDPGKIDIPFGDFVNYGESLNACAYRLLEPTNINPHKVRFVMRHHYISCQKNRMLYLGIIVIEPDEVLQIERYPRNPGKFWTQKQIEEELSCNIFAESFVKEYEAIKSYINSYKELDDADNGL